MRSLLDGLKTDVAGEVVRTRGYRLRLAAPRSPLVVAAFGPQAIEVAARHADRLVLNLIDPTLAGELIGQLEQACARLGRPRPRVAIWVACAVGAIGLVVSTAAAYLAAPGFSDMFTRAGFGELCAFAATGPHPGELLKRVPAELNEVVGLVGDKDQVAARMQEYLDVGIDDVVIVPSATEEDPAGERTLRSALEVAAALSPH